MVKRLLSYFILTLFILSCKDDDIKKLKRIRVDMEYTFGNEVFEPDSLRYEILSGDSVSVTRMEYYISNIEFYKNGVWKGSDAYFYMNALDPKGFSIEADVNSCDSIRLILGLTPENNKTSALKPLPENVKMAWPDVMGGGYHFLKLEGHFLDKNREYKGYALHMGTNATARTHVMPLDAELTEDEQELKLAMDIGSWFQSPYTFDFKSGLNYTMGIDSLMTHLANNGEGSIKVVDFK